MWWLNDSSRKTGLTHALDVPGAAGACSVAIQSLVGMSGRAIALRRCPE